MLNESHTCGGVPKPPGHALVCRTARRRRAATSGDGTGPRRPSKQGGRVLRPAFSLAAWKGRSEDRPNIKGMDEGILRSDSRLDANPLRFNSASVTGQFNPDNNQGDNSYLCDEPKELGFLRAVVVCCRESVLRPILSLEIQLWNIGSEERLTLNVKVRNSDSIVAISASLKKKLWSGALLARTADDMLRRVCKCLESMIAITEQPRRRTCGSRSMDCRAVGSNAGAR